MPVSKDKKLLLTFEGSRPPRLRRSTDGNFMFARRCWLDCKGAQTVKLSH
jgi:hypothetical protein